MTKEEKIVGLIYKLYGSDSGVLFGIESKHKKAVEVIVRLTLEMEKDMK